MKKRILVVLGTRPEAIKLAPLILAMQKSEKFEVIVCNTEQQLELSNQALGFFNIKADINLNIMTPNQTLSGLQALILPKLQHIFENNKFDATIVQGDTMSVFCGALASFYNKTPVFHVEAGLRSGNIFEPFPEEAFRSMVSKITTLHFAPTLETKQALIEEDIDEDTIFKTGNTVIDALYCLKDEALVDAQNYLQQNEIVLNDKIVLITAHRRENHGERLYNILTAIKTLANDFTDHQFIIPVHPNPNVKIIVENELNDLKNIKLLPPLNYPVLVTLMKYSKLVITDSGGIQEEAPSFGTPVLVLRYKTERMEGVSAGFAKLVGADTDLIVAQSKNILAQNKSATRLDSSKNPYGDGTACQQIIKIMETYFEK